MLNIGSNTSILASASFLAPDPVDSLPPAVRSGRPRTGKRSDGLPPEWVVAHHHRDFQSKRAYAPLFAHVAQSGWIRDTELENRTFDQFIATDRIRALVLDGRQAEEGLATTIYHVRHDLLSRIPIFVVLDRADPGLAARMLQAGADEVVETYLDYALFEAKITAIARLDRLAFNTNDTDRFGDYSFDTRRNIVGIAGTRVKLTPTQFRIALYFFRNLDKTLPFWKMIDDLWQDPQPNIADSIRVHVCRIRQKLMLDGTHGYSLSRYNRGGYRLYPRGIPSIQKPAVQTKVAA